jgi:hypothetical protein
LTYLKAVMLGLDDLGAAALLNRNDLCISAACGLVREGRDAPLMLHSWQRIFLTGVGAALDFFWAGHCEGAIVGDVNRANSTLALLQGPTKCQSSPPL